MFNQKPGGLFGSNQGGQQGAGNLFGQNKPTGGGLFGGGQQQQQQQGQQTQQGGGLFGGNQQKPGGLFGGGQQQQQGQTQGGGLFGGNQQKPGGGLFGNQQQGQQQQQGGGGLFGNQQQQQGQQQGGLFGGQQQQGQQSSGGLFGGNNQQKPSGGLFGNTGGTTSGGGSLFGGSGQQQQSSGGLFGGNKTIGGNAGGSLFGGGQSTGQSGGLFGGQSQQGGGLFGQNQQQQQQQQMLNLPDNRKFGLSRNNPFNNQKLGAMPQGVLTLIAGINDSKEKNKKERSECWEINDQILAKREEVISEKSKVAQKLKEFATSLSQANLLVDQFKSEHESIGDAISIFENHCNRIRGGELPRFDLPSEFMINITEYFNITLDLLKRKVEEIEEMIKSSSISSDAEEYEKLILVLEEMYNYFMNVSYKVFQFNQKMNILRQHFKEYLQVKGGANIQNVLQGPANRLDNCIGLLDKMSDDLAKKEEAVATEIKTFSSKNRNTKTK